MKYYISLGSNLGNRLKNLQDALNYLEQGLLQNIQVSIVIETKAILPPNAPKSWNISYFNMIVVGTSSLDPGSMLHSLKNIELQLGRKLESPKWSPRVIDLDILLVDDLVISNDLLNIPHAELLNRDFLIYLLRTMVDFYDFVINNRKSDSIFQEICSSLLKIEDYALDDLCVNAFVIKPGLVGIVNVTQDSFSDGGKFKNVDSVLKYIEKLMNEGATIVDIGVQSTRPNAQISHNDISEYNALSEILTELKPLISTQKLHVSIDTFRPNVMLKLIENYDIYWINDVKSSLDDDCLKEICNSGTKYCFMHSLEVPPQSNILNKEIDPVDTLMKWATKYKNRLIEIGFHKNNIIMDLGIGFGKNQHQNIHLMRNIQSFKRLNVPIMVGHSRKSYINAFAMKSHPMHRDIETIISSIAMKNRVDFLRVHNIKDHVRSMVAHEILSKN